MLILDYPIQILVFRLFLSSPEAHSSIWPQKCSYRNMGQSSQISGRSELWPTNCACWIFPFVDLIRHQSSSRSSRIRQAIHLCTAPHEKDNIVEYLLSHGADPNAITTTVRTTSLYISAQQGHLSVAESLINHGAEVNKVTVDGATPLHVASCNGYLSIVQYLH